MLEGVVFVGLSVRSVWFVASLRQGHVIMVVCMMIRGEGRGSEVVVETT